MENLPTLNQKLKEYLECDSRILLWKNGIATPFSKAELKQRILYLAFCLNRYCHSMPSRNSV